MNDLLAMAQSIWRAGVASVDATTLVRQQVQADTNQLTICGETWNATPRSRLCIVGGGKAGAGMALGLEQALGPRWLSRGTGWLNVPAGTEQAATSVIHLHAARPAGVNEPRPAGVEGTQEILRLVGQCGPEDLCLVLISGGGSALLPAPRSGITLADKVALTQRLSRAGATIQQLNAVRRELSDIKGGGLLRVCQAGRLIAMLISDVIGDPLDVIASGPTACDPAYSAKAASAHALEVLRDLLPEEEVPPRVLRLLNEQSRAPNVPSSRSLPRFSNHIIGNNRTAVAAAAAEACRLGCDVVLQEHDRPGVAREVGVDLAQKCLDVRQSSSNKLRCLISGGEPIVRLRTTDRPQRGGRNQELVLAALCHWWRLDVAGLALLSGGTDGEDGPTDAAGAFVDEQVLQHAKQLQLDPATALDWNDSYPFFEECGGLLKSGPTGTNVMDLRVALIDSSTTVAD